MLPKKRRQKLIIFFILLSLIILLVINYIFDEKKLVEVSNMSKTNFLIEKAEYMENNTISGGTTYYISSEGTSNTGTDINNPMSLETANNKTFYGNDRILLKRGDIFYGYINFNIKADKENMVYIGCYGDENLERPIINGKTIVLNDEAWNLEEDIYVLDLSDFSNLSGMGSKSSNPDNVGFIKDENGNIFANRKVSKDLLNKEYDFYCDDNYLYLKSSKKPHNISYTTQVDLV